MENNKKYFQELLPIRPENSHKGTFGHVLNIAGSEFYTGAAYFSSIAPLKVGCGKSTLLSADCVLCSVSVLSPDIILMPEHKMEGLNIDEFQAISIGCGLSRCKHSVKLFTKTLKILKDSYIPVVIDADGLNILSELNKTDLPSNVILTPHPKELARLLNVSVEIILEQPDFWVKKCCEKYNCYTVLKLHKTLVADMKGNFYENNTGNSALSHGGSGDILCGMITGFLAQGLNCFEASCLAVYLHGVAGELASKDLTEYSALASDLLKYIPKAIKSIL